VKRKVGNFTVRMRCVVEKEVECHECTEEEARQIPWDFAQDEREVQQMDWEVLDVRSSE
jgi:hypothetical protein